MSEDKDPFFIGWLKSTPESYTKIVKPFLFFLIPLVLLVAFLMNFGRLPAENASAVYEFGKLTTVEGVLIKEPVPMLRAQLQDGNKTFICHFLLVDALKFSASKTIKAIEEKAETSLTNKSIQLEGTLSHYKGKNVLELTNGADAYLGLSNSTITLPVAQKSLGNKKIRGEIIDPKSVSYTHLTLPTIYSV